MFNFKNIDTIIFDLDGTLLDTVDDLSDSVNYALSFYGYPLKTKEDVRLAVGNGITKLMERTSPAGADISGLLEKFKEFYMGIKVSKTKPYDGIIELLTELKKKNIKIGVLSNKFDRGTKLHCKMFFDGLIDFAQGEDSINGILPKPNPKGVFKVMQALNAKNTIFAGDSEVDIQTAENADIPCISVLWGLKTKEFLVQKGGKIFVNKPSEILDML
ncbi:MAG: HAD family hydrolase [bacterium]|nr:HAD family hydrolase [bacterium]